MPSVLIKGDGVAALSCEWLMRLPPAYWQTIRQSGQPTRLPAIMISEATQQLFADVFARTKLFRYLPRIERRKVAWGDGADLLVLPHAAVVVEESWLLDRLRVIDTETAPPVPEDWTIFAGKPLPPHATEMAFGSRIAHAVPVDLAPAADAQACVIESLPSGWLFLVPNGNGAGWLLAVGGDADAQLSQSRFVAPDILRVASPGAHFAAHPRLTWPLCGPRWLACGTAALAFDPLCGDGSGNAIREAILASAVLRAHEAGSGEGLLLQHYQNRLLAGFERHLQVCAHFYQSGGNSPWWAEQLAGVEAGRRWCRAELGTAKQFHFRLDGFTLTPIENS